MASCVPLTNSSSGVTKAADGCGCSLFAISSANSRILAGVRRSDSRVDTENGDKLIFPKRYHEANPVINPMSPGPIPVRYAPSAAAHAREGFTLCNIILISYFVWLPLLN